MKTKPRTGPVANVQEALLRAVLDSPAVGVAITRPDLRWVEVNDQACELHGYPRSELVEKTWMELTHPDDLPHDLAQVGRLMAGQIDGYAADKRFVRKNGSVQWVHVSVDCVRRSDRTIEYFVAIMHDAGQRKRAEEALRESEARLRRVQEGSSDGFGDYRADTGSVTVNPRYCEIHGLPAGTREISTEALMERVEPADRPAILADMDAIRSGAKDAHVWEYRVRAVDGTTRWVQSRGRVVGRDASGAPSHVSGAITDITERRRIEEEQERLVQELRTALEQVKTLSGIVPICSGCKKIRDDQGYWEAVEAYVSRHTVARFSHGICPDCTKRLFPGH